MKGTVLSVFGPMTEPPDAMIASVCSFDRPGATGRVTGAGFTTDSIGALIASKTLEGFFCGAGTAAATAATWGFAAGTAGVDMTSLIGFDKSPKRSFFGAAAGAAKGAAGAIGAAAFAFGMIVAGVVVGAFAAGIGESLGVSTDAIGFEMMSKMFFAIF